MFPSQRALQRAVGLYGSEEALASRLEASVEQIRRWLEGAESIPVPTYLKLLDLIFDAELEAIRKPKKE